MHANNATILSINHRIIRGLLKNFSRKIKTNAVRRFDGSTIMMKQSLCLDNDGRTIETSDSISFNFNHHKENTMAFSRFPCEHRK